MGVKVAERRMEINFRLSLPGRKCARHFPMLACDAVAFSEGWSANFFPKRANAFSKASWFFQFEKLGM
jgi:hypothetical protein